MLIGGQTMVKLKDNSNWALLWIFMTFIVAVSTIAYLGIQAKPIDYEQLYNEEKMNGTNQLIGFQLGYERALQELFNCQNMRLTINNQTAQTVGAHCLGGNGR